MEHWFGQSWGAPCCEPELHMPTPVGKLCARCREPILVGDQGIVSPFASIETGKLVYHLDCYLKGILPHGADCPRCRGLERGEHLEACAYRLRGEECSCDAGELAP